MNILKELKQYSECFSLSLDNTISACYIKRDLSEYDLVEYKT